MANQPTRQDLYTRVTNQIARQLEEGVRPWMKPWSVEHTAGRITRPLRHNAIPYRGVNVLLLWSEALAKGYAAPLWMTYKQSQEMCAQVRKGEHGSLVIYADRIIKTETDSAGQDVEREIPFMKGYTVFNVEQIDGLPAHYYAQPVTPLPLSDRLAHAVQFVTSTGAAIHLGDNQAYYSPADDVIHLPPFETFKDKESYYATALHELTHWTRHETRLDRDFGRQRFGDAGYAREELVAELGAAFLCADLGITPEIRADHADYIGHWLTVLQDDKHAIFQAAAHAQRAADYLQGLQSALPSDSPSSQQLPAHGGGEDQAHSEVRSINPTAVLLPIAMTGFYTNTLPAWVITDAGSPVAYIDVMLAAESGSIMVKDQNPIRSATSHEKAVSL